MNYDENAAEVMKVAQKAAAFDNAQRYEEAVYCYTEAAQRIIKLLREKKIRPILRRNAKEYIERAEFLKRELPRLLSEVKEFKSENQLLYEKMEFIIMKAQDLDEQKDYAMAIDLYKEAIQLCIQTSETCEEEALLQIMRRLGTQSLRRAEELELLEEKKRVDLLTQNLPDVPVNELSQVQINDSSSQHRLDDRIPSGRGAPAAHCLLSPTGSGYKKLDGLSKDELAVLAVTSNINGRNYVPFLSVDLQEKFNFTQPFIDKDGKLRLTDKQRKRIKAWLRPCDIMNDPQVIRTIDSGTIKQTLISDCSFISSLSIAARYERRFGKQIVTSIIYPQNNTGQPIYNLCGKYMVKFHINGVWRKVIIDDFFPTGGDRELLCSHSQQRGELWVSLLEKAYLKVMGGYDFPGSNSNIDLHALTGWIPERIAIKKNSKDFDGDKIFEKLLVRFHRGDCLITLATGRLDKETCDRAGLVECHAYAVLDLRRIENKRLLMLKNPWTHLRWKGRFSENDKTSWTSELCRALDYDPNRAQENDDGVFWIDYESICHFFEVFYVNWNPAVFPFTYALHASWNSCTGPIKDLYSVADNPQYTLEIYNKSTAAVWILLTRHIMDIADFANNQEYITVIVYHSGKKVYIPVDPKPLYEGVRINSPHYLCQMVIKDPGLQKYTLVVAQHEKMNTIFYTLRVYSSVDFTLNSIKNLYTVKKVETSKWHGKSAGGCGNGPSKETWQNNPLFQISLAEGSDENSLLIDLKGPKQYNVGFEIRQISSIRSKSFERRDSGVYRPGYTILILESVPAGVYSIRPMTFEAGQEGPFILKVEASCAFSMKQESFATSSDETNIAVMALKYAADEINSREDAPFRLSYEHHDIHQGSSEAWSIVNAVCQELKEGGMGLISIDSGRGYESVRGLSDTIEMPLISLSPPLFPVDPPHFFEISIRPSPAELLADFIIHKQWSDIILFNDREYSGLSMPWLWHHLHLKTNNSVSAQLIELPSDSEKFEEFLRKFNLRRGNSINRILIDTTSSLRQQKFLAAIRGSQFNQANYHYVATNFDFLPYDVEMFQNGNINISGFQLINKESRGYWNLKKHLKKKDRNFINNYDDVDARAALAHDAVLVAWHGFAKCLSSNDSLFHGTFRHGRFFNRGYPGIYCDPLADRAHPNRPFASFEHGRTVSKALRSLRIDSKHDGTLTGNIEFDRFGHRKNYDVTVFDLVSNTKATFSRKEIMAWRQGIGFFSDRTVAHHTRKPITNRSKSVVRVITVLVNPFAMIKDECQGNNNKTECLGNNKYEGYCIDLLNLLAKRINGFNFEVSLETTAGSKLPDGSWDGMIGEMLSGRADVAVSSLTINQERERVVDFSKPFMTTGISIMIKKPDSQEFSVFSFMQPLSTEIWMYIIFAYIGVSVVIFLVSRFSPYEWRVEETAHGGFTISNDFSVYNCLWFTLAAFMQQGTDILPRSISGRIASSAWWFFTMIIVSSYTANLAAFLTLEKMQAPIESVEDLAKQTKIKYGIQGGGSTASFFKCSSVQIYQRMWRYMESQVPSVFVSSYKEGIERVRNHKGRYAFLLEATSNEYQNTRKPCDTMKVGANLNSIGYGVATPFGSDWKDQINLAILDLQEKGELKKLENTWWYDRGQCDQGITVDGSSSSLNLSKVAGIFYILMGGMVVSMIAALGEFLYRSRIEARKANSNSLVGNFAKNLKSTLSSQLRLSIQGGAVAQPGTQSHEALKRQQAASFLPASNNEEKRTIEERGLRPVYPYNTAV